MRTVHEGDAFFMQRDDLLQVIVLRRRATRLEADQLKNTFESLAPGLTKINRGDWGLLLDMRDAPMRNDVEFERAMGNEVATLLAGFRRRAVLVKTAVGALQLHRAARSLWGEDPDSQPEVFRDEAEAMQHLHS